VSVIPSIRADGVRNGSCLDHPRSRSRIGYRLRAVAWPFRAPWRTERSAACFSYRVLGPLRREPSDQRLLVLV